MARPCVSIALVATAIALLLIFEFCYVLNPQDGGGWSLTTRIRRDRSLDNNNDQVRIFDAEKAKSGRKLNGDRYLLGVGRADITGYASLEYNFLNAY